MLGFPDSPAILFQFTPLREGRRNRFAQLWVRLVDFNSRPSARGDEAGLLRRHGGQQFQFTPLREGRRFFQRILRWLKHFNSRPSARGDGMKVFMKESLRISIHAPPRGATGRAS